MPGVVAFCGHRAQNIWLSAQSGWVPLRDVVAPAHVVLVQQVGEVGPRRSPAACRLPLAAGRRAASVGLAAHRVAVLRAVGRPAGDEYRCAGRLQDVSGLEHVVLEDEVLRVVPVVRDLAPVVVAHHVGRRRRQRAARGCRAGVQARCAAAARLRDRSRPSCRRRCRRSRRPCRAGRPQLRSAVSWYGFDARRASIGSGDAGTVPGLPASPGIPSAPG